jgi:hypothetical protein
MIDAYPCAGLSACGERLYRTAALRQNDGAEVLVYDPRGICRYVRVDEIGDPHDALALEDGRLLLVSSRDNAIVSLEPDGTLAPVWRVDAPIDAWHVNCLAQRDGRLFATAFGRFDTFRGWHPTLGAHSGVLFDVESGADAVTGLTQPHSPRWIDDAWVICNSGEHSVVRVESNGHRFAVPVGGFSRGMCAIGAHVYVGVSTPRAEGAMTAPGWISVLDRERWIELDRIGMPCAAMYDLVEVNEELLAGLETGFRFGSNRDFYFGQLAMFEQVGATPQRVWAIAEPLPPAMCRIGISADLPAAIALGDVVRVTCTVENRGDGFLISAAPHPVEVCYRWFDSGGNAVGAGTWLHTPLPHVLAPRGAATFSVLIAPPPVCGRFTIRLTLLQEGVVWFDDIDLANAVTGDVEIGDGHRETPAGPAQLSRA